MANILGQIMVVLGANTASFEQGMNAADKLAQKTGKDIERAFEDMGSKAEGILGALGPIAGQFSGALSGIGSTARAVLGELGPIAGAIGPIGVGLAGVAAVGAGAAVALSGIAIHAAEADARLGELSHSTGVSVESLSLLGEVASTKGIGIDQMGTALERMSRSAFAAAQAPTTARNAYTQLGIAVTTAGGQMRQAQDIFNDIAQKFAGMADGPQKTALAIQIFGRSGAELIPLLDQGGAKLEQLAGHFEKLGAVVSGPLAEASEQLKENEVIMGGFFKGIENQIASDLLPAINAIAEDWIKTGENGHSAIQNLTHDIDVGVKAVIGLGDDLIHVFAQIGLVLEGIGGGIIATFNLIGAEGEAAVKAASGDWEGAKEAAHQGLAGVKAEWDNFWDGTKKNWSDNNAFWHQMFGSLPPAEKTNQPAGPPVEHAPGKEPGERMFESLQQSTQAELALAAATTQSVAAQEMQKASGEADQIIARMLEAAHGNLTKKLQDEIAVVHALTAERLIAKDAVTLNAELTKETESYQRQIDSLTVLSDAYRTGGNAIGDAMIGKQLEADKQKISDYTAKLDLLKKAQQDYLSGKAALAGAPGPVQGIQGIEPAAIKQLETELEKANADLAEHKRQLEAIRAANYDVEINKQADALRGEQPLLEALNDAYLQNAEAVRKAQVALSLYHWEQSHPGATPEQIQQENQILEEQSIDAQRAADVKAAAQYKLSTLYTDEIDKLMRIREVLQENGDNTLLIDAKIHDAQDGLIHQWDEAAMKVGDFHDKFSATMNELVIEGNNAGKSIADSFLGAIHSGEDDLAKFLTGQKVQPQKIVQNMAEQITKAEIQKVTGEIAGHFGVDISGLGGSKPDGTSSNPLHVAIVRGMPGPTSAAAGLPAWFDFGVGPGSKNGPAMLGLPHHGGIGSPDGSSSNPFYVVSSTPEGSPVGKSAGSETETPGAGAAGSPTGHPDLLAPLEQTVNTFSSALLPFAGALAGGGQTRPGTTYLVGESGPELFRSSSAGEVLPSGQVASQAGPQNWTFNPSAPYAQSYEAYERWLHRGPGDGPLFQSMGMLGLNFLFKGLLNRQSPAMHLGKVAAAEPSQNGSLADLNALTASQSVAPAVPMVPDVGPLADLNALTASVSGFRAAGGSVSSGATYMVGEHGPELFRPTADGEIVPNHLLSGFMADGGDVFADRTYMVGERGPEAYRVPSMSSISNVSSGNRGGDVYHGDVIHGDVVNQTINAPGGNDLFGFTDKQKLERAARKSGRVNR